MAYGYYGYQPYQGYPAQDNLAYLRNQQMQSPPVTQANQDERIWVSSQSAAEAYLMTPNSFVRLWDSNAPVFYEKRTDGQGRPYPMDTYRYSLEDRTNTKKDVSEKDNTEIQERLQKLEERLALIESGMYGGGKHDSKSYSNDATIQPV